MAKAEPALARSIAQAIKATKLDEAMLAKLTDLIDRGDFRGVDTLIGGSLRDNLEAGNFSKATSGAFNLGAAAGAAQMPAAAQTRASLNMTNPAAVQYLEQNLPGKIVAITEESRRAVQQALLRGFNEGRPTVDIARDVRNVIGLTEDQGRYVLNFRRQLETGELGGTTPPDQRRLSAAEQAQAERMRREALDGNPAAQARIDAMVDRYHNSLINRRAQNIARTESTAAFGEGRRAMWKEAVDRGLIDPAKTRRHWLITPDGRTRPDHVEVPIMNPNGVAMGQPYDTPIGPVMAPRTSGDPGFDINCRCDEVLTFEDGYQTTDLTPSES